MGAKRRPTKAGNAGSSRLSGPTQGWITLPALRGGKGGAKRKPTNAGNGRIECRLSGPTLP